MISVKIRYLVIGVGIINKKHTLLHKVHILLNWEYLLRDRGYTSV